MEISTLGLPSSSGLRPMCPSYLQATAMLSRNIVCRGLSSAATAAKLPTIIPPPQETVSVLPNGLTVSSVDLHGAVSQLVLAFRAGTRYEQPNELGLVHHLRNLVGTDSANYMGLKLLWQAGGIGSNIHATTSKDFLSIHMNVVRTYANVGLSLLGELSQPAYKAWDVADNVPTVRSDLEHQTPFEFVLENLHAAAYRNGCLANPLLSPIQKVGKINYKDLSAYASSRLVASEAVIVGVNVDHSVLVDYASSQGAIAEGGAKKSASPSPYFGGDSRVHGNTSLAHIIIAGQGAKLSDEKSVAVFAVLAEVIGNAPNVKYTTSPGQGVVAKAVGSAANHHPVGVSAVNIVYSDSGLAGVYLVAEGERIAASVKAAVSAIKGLATNGVDAEILAAAKKYLQVQISVNGNSSATLANDRALQVLSGVTPSSPSDFGKSIDAVTSDDLKKAAAQVVSKLSLSAYGRINQVPYLDQL